MNQNLKLCFSVSLFVHYHYAIHLHTKNIHVCQIMVFVKIGGHNFAKLPHVYNS